jgi:hypothetical protein
VETKEIEESKVPVAPAAKWLAPIPIDREEFYQEAREDCARMAEVFRNKSKLIRSNKSVSVIKNDPSKIKIQEIREVAGKPAVKEGTPFLIHERNKCLHRLDLHLDNQKARRSPQPPKSKSKERKSALRIKSKSPNKPS